MAELTAQQVDVPFCYKASGRLSLQMSPDIIQGFRLPVTPGFSCRLNISPSYYIILSGEMQVKY